MGNKPTNIAVPPPIATSHPIAGQFQYGSPSDQWSRLRENLQETMFLTSEYQGFLYIFFYHP
jgi:hypothetical protein